MDIFRKYLCNIGSPWFAMELARAHPLGPERLRTMLA